ncbi:MAG: alkaline phosphatase family protein [bacterium]|jgi:predicted AlkP superfamily phosphohydrolase/phosphomutase
MSAPRVFLLGIDGATWKVIDKMIARGLMPNMERLVREGTRGVLNSTIPYLTPVAWSSMLTGVRPSKHGIFGYNVMENREGMIIGLLANRSKIKVPTIFDIYHQLGRKIISLNMPMSYPPSPDDGIVITGLMTPSRESTYFYPSGLIDELSARGIDYKIDITVAREEGAELDDRLNMYLADGARRFFEDLRQVTEEREKAVHYLLDSKEWDLFQINFVSMDRIQHYLWEHIWKDGPDSLTLKRIEEHLAYLDGVIGKIYDRVRSEALLLICSDHGFGDYKGNFYPAVWLKQNGYYTEMDTELSPGLIIKRILKTLRLSKLLLRFLERSGKTVAKKLIYVGTSNVSWKKTRAYVYSTAGIRINVKGRDQFGIVEPGEEFEALREEIRRKMLAMTDESGQRIMKGVYTAEELYGSACPDESPDLFFEFKDDHFYTTYYAITASSVFLDKGYSWRQGDHRQDGVVLLAGDGIVRGKTIVADIEDILPTILFIQDLPLSENFDGKIMKDAFTDEFVRKRKPQDRRFFERGEVEASEEDQGEEVIDRLKGLGYI